MAGKYTPIYGFPQPQDSDVIDAKDIADLAQKVENELNKGIPIPAMKEDGYWYLKDINTGRKWKPEKGKDYYTEADQEEFKQFAKDTAESVKTQAESDLAAYKANVEADIKQRLDTSATNIEQAKADALNAISDKETALNQNIDTAKTDIDQKVAGAEQIKKDIAQIQGTVSQSETNINKAKSDIQELKNTIDTTAETIANNKLAAEKAKTGAETAEKQSTDALTTIQGLAQGINTTAEQVTQNAISAGDSRTAAETAKNQAQEIANNLQGTINNANQAAGKANDAAQRAEQAAQAVQPDATKTSKGIVQVGEGIEVSNGIISVDQSGKADKSHSHQITDITGLDEALKEAGKVQSVNDKTGAVKINAVPDGGTVGQVLKKTSTGYAWSEDKDTHPDLSPYAKTSDVDKKLDKKVDKVEGKGLSTNDYSNDAKSKVDAIPNNPNYTDTTYSNATSKKAGLMSGADKSKLDDIEAGATKTTILDSLTSTSATSALSANQGRALKEQITQTNDKFGEVARLKVLTQAQFEALTTKDPGTLYLVKEG